MRDVRTDLRSRALLAALRLPHFPPTPAPTLSLLVITHSLFYQALTCPDDRQVPSRPLILKVLGCPLPTSERPTCFLKKKVRDH